MPNDPGPPPPEPRLWRAVPRGPVLHFAPHPDDEVAGTGGVLAMHRAQGDAVHVVVATDGIAGDPDRKFAQKDYAERRRAESRNGLAEVGVDQVVFWGFPDNCELSAADVELGVQSAVRELERVRPAVVYLPWEREGHPDHHSLFVIVTTAIARAGWCGWALGYEVWNAMVPDVIVDVTAFVEQKRRGMLAHESQLEYTRYDHCMLGLSAYRSMVHLKGRGYGEAFRVVASPPGAAI
ncbi:MAG: PIG-L family deacetylase [Planctomycetes bacterium]|nr:PIG-L family deacetylase [Planctomycetota bacterium]